MNYIIYHTIAKMISSQQSQVKVHFTSSNETFLMPKKPSELTFGELIDYITNKQPDFTHDTHVILIQTKGVSRRLQNEAQFVYCKELALGQQDRFMKLTVQKIIEDEDQFYECEQKAAIDIHEVLEQPRKNSKALDWKKECFNCKQIKKDDETLYSCYTCRNVYLCQECEQLDVHRDHPLIKLNSLKHLEMMEGQRQGKIQKMLEQIKNVTTLPLKKINCNKPQGFFDKLFGPSAQPEDKVLEDAYAIEIKAAMLGSLFNQDSAQLMEFVRQNKEKEFEWLVQEILNKPENFKLGL